MRRIVDSSVVSSFVCVVFLDYQDYCDPANRPQDNTDTAYEVMKWAKKHLGKNCDVFTHPLCKCMYLFCIVAIN